MTSILAVCLGITRTPPCSVWTELWLKAAKARLGGLHGRLGVVEAALKLH